MNTTTTTSRSDLIFYEGSVAFILPVISGSLSFLSSSFIVWLIWRSRRNSSYHRIMAFMSVWEMIRSLCIALSTVPMPKDVIYTYYGNSYGNVKTCEVQAFLIIVGSGMALFANICLTLYYLLTIRYYVKEHTLKRYVEPIFLVLSTVLSLVLPVLFLKIEYLNPTPYEVFCNVGSYPHRCEQLKDAKQCLRGQHLSVDMLNFFRNYAISMMCIELMFFLVSMTLIVMTFYKSDVELARILKTLKPGEDDNNISPFISRRFTTKIIAQQALMYFTALVLSWIFFAVSFFKETQIISICKQIFFPLRGTLNMLIFVYHKVYAIKRCQPRMSYYTALKYLICKTKHVPEDVVSNLEMVVEQTGRRDTVAQHKKNRKLRLLSHNVSLSASSEQDYSAVDSRGSGLVFGKDGELSLFNHDGSIATYEKNEAQETKLQEFDSLSMFSHDRSDLSIEMKEMESFEVE